MSEFKFILGQCSAYREDFRVIAEHVRKSSKYGDASTEDPLRFFKQVENESYAWLADMGTFSKVDNIDRRSNLWRIIVSFGHEHKPLRITSNNPELVKEVQLGSQFQLHFQAEGNPKPCYEWFFMAPSGGDEKWEPLGIDHEYLIGEDLVPEDCGFYQCLARHCIPLIEKGGLDVPGIYSECVEVKIAPGSIHLKKDLEDMSSPFGGKVVFSLGAKSLQPLSYQWYRNGTPLAGENSPDLTLQHVTFDLAGKYRCLVKNSLNEVESNLATLEVILPTEEELERKTVTFTNETILILKEPQLCEASAKRSIGEHIVLKCMAVCKYDLDYQWVRQGFVQDLVEEPRDPVANTPIEPVSHSSPHMEDDIPSNPVSFWIYHCIVTCHETGQSVKSSPVRIQISLSVSSMQKLPTFKVALLICIDDYRSDYFHKLNAPRNDGIMLAATLRKMGFFILSFTNLTRAEIQGAVRLYAKFIDSGTYSLFYFNGHSIGNGEDLFLAAKDTMLDGSRPVPEDVVFLNSVEEPIDNQDPLLSLFIYDSCRERAPENLIRYVTSHPRPVAPFKSSTIKAFGTRPEMKNYESQNADGRYQGVYMKHLLKHIMDRGSVGEVFEKVTDSYTRGEGLSLQKRMLPEFKNATKQILSLSSPCRSTKYNALQRRFFETFSYDAMVEDCLRSSGFPGALSRDLGIARSGSGFTWVTGRSEGQAFQGIVSIQIRRSHFDNEAR